MRTDADSMVSVIVPIYNAEQYLAECLESILAQSHRALEVLCINDGSTDGSPDILERFATRDERIHVISKENGGYGAACNLGIEKARGEWISIVEPDDWIEPDMYADMLAFASRFDEQIDIVKTPWFNVQDWDDPEKQHSTESPLARRIKTSTHPFVLADEPILITLHPSIWSALYRRGFLNECSIRFPEYPGAGWADNPFLVETFCQAKAIIYLDQPYYQYRADLPGSTLNHGSVEAIRRPFDRWCDMADIMERLSVTDGGTWDAHYMRAFAYAEGAIHDDGWDNPAVQEGMKRMFSRMDAQRVFVCPAISPRRCELFAKVLGLPIEDYKAPNRTRYLLGEAWGLFRSEGIGGIIGRLRTGRERRKEMTDE